MTVKKITTILAATLLIATQTATVSAQPSILQDDAFSGSSVEHDLQFFSPVDFDFDNQPIKRKSGFFFRYDKLNWAATGDRVAVGDPDVTYAAQSHFTNGVIPADGAPPVPYTVVNGINDSAPYATFAWGERYEFGLQSKNSSWTVGILDGPAHNTSQSYGFGVGSNFLGFGSVVIAMTTENPDVFLGFAETMQNDAPINGSIDNILDDPDIERVIDDVNGNGIFDLGDTLLLLPVWEQVFVRNLTETDGIELMRSFRIDNSHRMVKDQNSHLEFGYGMRFFRLRDQFDVNALGGRFGDSDWTSETDNQIIGPQVQLAWERQNSRWNFSALGKFAFGYNVQNMDQLVNFGSALMPGAQEKPLFLNPTSSANGRRDDAFSPLAEIRAEASYMITNALSFRLGYTGMFVNNIRRASSQISWNAPDFGIRDGGLQDIYINGANLGFDVVY